MAKKGMNDVIVTVLIVLVALGATAMIWAYIKSAMGEASEETDKTILGNLEIMQGSVSYNPDSRLVQFRVRRLPGGDNVDGFYVALEGEDGKIAADEYYGPAYSLGELENVMIDNNFNGPINYSGYPWYINGSLKKITITAMYLKASGKIKLGPNDQVYYPEGPSSAMKKCNPGEISNECLVCADTLDTFIRNDSLCSPGEKCSENGACSPTSNSAPLLINASTSPDSVKPNEVVTFIANWSDDIGDRARIIVCSTGSGLNSSSTGCKTSAYCESSFTSNGASVNGFSSCSYTVPASEPAGRGKYWVYVCDEYNTCSTRVKSGTFTILKK